MATETNVPDYIRSEALAKKLSVSEATIYRWKKSGVLPAPYHLGPRVVAWKSAEIDQFFATRHAA